MEKNNYSKDFFKKIDILNPSWVTLIIVFGFLFFYSTSLLAFDHSHSEFNQVLQNIVVIKGPKSQVRYGWLKKNPTHLKHYLQSLEKVTLSQFKGWSRSEQMAFLINSYNARTLELILTKYPDLVSIKDLGGFFSSPWDIKFFKLFKTEQNLNYIEHGLLRAKYKDSRIHFAIVCASKSCPPLSNQAYQADTLDEQLNRAREIFLSDPQKNLFVLKSATLELSPIFKWFKEDFIAEKGSLIKYVIPWIKNGEKLQEMINNDNLKIHFMDYDWTLNNFRQGEP